MKKLLVGLLSLVLIFCVGCSGKNPNDIFSSESSNKKDESVIDTPDPEESTDSEDISKEEDSSDDTSSTEKEDEKDDDTLYCGMGGGIHKNRFKKAFCVAFTFNERRGEIICIKNF